MKFIIFVFCRTHLHNTVFKMFEIFLLWDVYMRWNISKYMILSTFSYSLKTYVKLKCNILNFIGFFHRTFMCQIITSDYYLDNELSFNDHVSTICKKAGKQLNVLIRLSHVIDKQSKMLLYNTFIKSHFQFCSLVWHFCNHIFLKWKRFNSEHYDKSV